MNDKWVKPFSSGMSCLDTVDGVCLTDITADECEKYCEDHPFCDTGYHLQYADKTYCAPLHGLFSFARRQAFSNSTFPVDQSIFFHPDIGVKMRVFDEKKKIQKINYPQYVSDIFILPTVIQHLPTGKYLTSELKLDSDISQACVWQIFRFIYNFSGSNSTFYDRISNGEIVLFRSVNDDMTISFQDNTLQRLPMSMLFGYSTSYNYANVYYFQIFQSTDLKTPLQLDQPFAIRVNQLPILPDSSVYYLDIDDNSSLQPISVTDSSASLEEFRNWLFIRVENGQEIQQFPDSLFIESQWVYAKNFLGASLDENDNENNIKSTNCVSTSHVRSMIIIVIVIVVIIALIIRWRKYLI